MKEIIKPYRKDSGISYTAGAYATIELLLTHPDWVESVYIHSAYSGSPKIKELCAAKRIPVHFGDHCFRRINQKENTYVLAVFQKPSVPIRKKASHVILVNPADMGNLGTVIRTALAFGISDLALITPGADPWHPKTVRASMGAIFRSRIEQFPTIEEYFSAYPGHCLYSFMLDGQYELGTAEIPIHSPFALVFGNEGGGLTSEYHEYGYTVKIRQSDQVDSLNLASAVAVAAFTFMNLKM